jgi:acetoin utilization deacetylase AcuC-like enzyme
MDFGLLASASPTCFPWKQLVDQLSGVNSPSTNLPANLVPSPRPLLVTALEVQQHLCPPDDPERPARTTAILELLHRLFDNAGSIDWAYVRSTLPNFTPSLAHSSTFLSELSSMLSSFMGATDSETNKLRVVDGERLGNDGETYVSAGTAGALHATSEAIRVAVNAVLRGDHMTAAAITRPPGHHCSHFTRLFGGQQFGFCLLNNAMQVSLCVRTFISLLLFRFV